MYDSLVDADARLLTEWETIESYHRGRSLRKHCVDSILSTVATYTAMPTSNPSVLCSTAQAEAKPHTAMDEAIKLSINHMGGTERKRGRRLRHRLDSAALPHVDEFERRLAALPRTGQATPCRECGTAAIHLAPCMPRRRQRRRSGVPVAHLFGVGKSYRVPRRAPGVRRQRAGHYEHIAGSPCRRPRQPTQSHRRISESHRGRGSYGMPAKWDEIRSKSPPNAEYP